MRRLEGALDQPRPHPEGVDGRSLVVRTFEARLLLLAEWVLRQAKRRPGRLEAVPEDVVGFAEELLDVAEGARRQARSVDAVRSRRGQGSVSERRRPSQVATRRRLAQSSALQAGTAVARVAR